MKKKSNFLVLAESIVNKKLANVDISLEGKKKLKQEMKRIVSEELGKIKELEDVDVEEDNWGAAELANQLKWMDALNISEALSDKKGK